MQLKSRKGLYIWYLEYIFFIPGIQFGMKTLYVWFTLSSKASTHGTANYPKTALPKASQ